MDFTVLRSLLIGFFICVNSFDSLISNLETEFFNVEVVWVNNVFIVFNLLTNSFTVSVIPLISIVCNVLNSFYLESFVVSKFLL